MLGGAAFRFYTILGSVEGADVAGHYSAAALPSLVRGGEPTLAIDRHFESGVPRTAIQSIMNDYVSFVL